MTLLRLHESSLQHWPCGPVDRGQQTSAGETRRANSWRTGVTLHRGDTFDSLSSCIKLKYGKNLSVFFHVLGLIKSKPTRDKLCSLACATEHFSVSCARSCCRGWWGLASTIESFDCKIRVGAGCCRICNLLGELRDQNTPSAPPLPHTPGPGMCEWPCDAIRGSGQKHLIF